VKQFSRDNRIISFGFSPDGKYLVSGESWTGSITLWEVETGIEERTFAGHKRGVNYVSFSPNGKYLISSGNDKTIRLWDVQTGNEVRKFSAQDAEIQFLSFSTDGKYLATSASGDSAIKICELETGKVVKTFGGVMHSAWRASFSPDWKYLASGSKDRIIKIWEIKTGSELRTLHDDMDYISRISFSPNGKYLASVSRNHEAELKTSDNLYDFVKFPLTARFGRPWEWNQLILSVILFVVCFAIRRAVFYSAAERNGKVGGMGMFFALTGLVGMYFYAYCSIRAIF
jgi:WD40 repeat protein